jgi:hypothetical protein
MIEFLLGAITLLVGVLVGFSLGKGSSIIPEETRKQVRRLIQALPIKRDIGAVERPSAQQIKRFENPALKAEEEEMNKTFNEIVPK